MITEKSLVLQMRQTKTQRMKTKILTRREKLLLILLKVCHDWPAEFRIVLLNLFSGVDPNSFRLGWCWLRASCYKQNKDKSEELSDFLPKKAGHLKHCIIDLISLSNQYDETWFIIIYNLVILLFNWSKFDDNLLSLHFFSDLRVLAQ